ncbi:stage V sporulation protein AB [Bacillus carboniphilus]|uniref:Stage V sporulation protein AB n=1 Tax=Bacillus carboniphilus TaxID=86663 RepID=A0ABY9K1L1_9BACI|nr:stage V sporulation protein AB [Bacillus carboniphilus]WLR43801.1 stage V sporulation protein AB [Bacillus carboniphilus]
MTLKAIFTVFIGFSGGFAVGGGFVAFLTVLGVIPRLTQLSKTQRYIRYYEWAVIIGAVVAGWLSLTNPRFSLSPVWLIPIGLLDGIFIGMLAAALTEVLNVLPVLSKRIGASESLISLLTAIVLGKVLGSLFHWLWFAF